VIDLAKETMVPLPAACRMMPQVRPGKTITLSGVLRWVMKGVKLPTGEIVRLEAVRLGTQWQTSREAIQRFAEATGSRTQDVASANQP
jgi:Protein of unknown function (DUF1580)